jgi:hypothetical protein
MLHVVHGRPVRDLGTGLGPKHAGERGAPVLDVPHVVAEPRGVLGGAVLPVRPPGHLRAAAPRGDGEGEGGEAEERGDEQHDGEEVEPERPRDVEAGAHEAGEGDDEHDEADGEQRRLQHGRARRRRALGQPQPRPDDRDRGQERRQVQVADHQVAEAVRIHLRSDAGDAALARSFFGPCVRPCSAAAALVSDALLLIDTEWWRFFLRAVCCNVSRPVCSPFGFAF